MEHNCPRCLKDFPHASKLSAHLARKTPCGPKPEPTTQCLRCHKDFSTPGNLRQHQARGCKPPPAEEENPRECPHCKKIFSQQSARNLHVRRGCPATMPGGAAPELAAEVRRLRESSLKLVRELVDYDILMIANSF